MTARRPVLVYRETLLAPSEPFITAQGESLQRHEAWYLGLRRRDAHPVPAERDLRWSAGGRAAPVRRWAWKRWGASASTLGAIRRLGPVAVHAHFGRDAAQVLPAARRLDLPLVVTFHGHDATRTTQSLRDGSWSDRLYLDRWDQLAAAGARFLAVSSAVEDRLLARGLPASKVERHYIGVDTERIAAADLGAREADLVVFVGRLVPHKGADDLVAALSRLRPSPRLVVLGDGPDRASLEASAAAGGVDARFLGFLPPHEVWSWMARAGVVVVPSRTGADGWQEAFGLVAAEAQAAGAPVVATTSGGLPEAVAPVNADLLVPEGDVAALADRISAVLGHATEQRRRGLEGRAWVAAERDLTTQTRRLDAVYEEVAP